MAYIDVIYIDLYYYIYYVYIHHKKLKDSLNLLFLF